jgi:putative transposase
MAYVKIWLHCVWGTKYRDRILTEEVRKDLIDHILENARTKNINIDSINGYKDHLHCLICLAPDQTLAKVIQLIKGESSFWMNKNKKIRYKFEWADEYYAASVSKSHLKKVRQYIANQERKHSHPGIHAGVTGGV